MALTICPDCKSEISDVAPSCPRCGRPSTTPAPEMGSRLGNGCFIGLVAVVGIVGLLIIFSHGERSGAPSTAVAPKVPCSELMELTSQAFGVIEQQTAKKYGFTISQSDKQCRSTEPGQRDAVRKTLDFLKPEGMKCEIGNLVRMSERLTMANMRCAAKDGVISVNVGYDSSTGELVMLTNGMKKK